MIDAGQVLAPRHPAELSLVARPRWTASKQTLSVEHADTNNRPLTRRLADARRNGERRLLAGRARQPPRISRSRRSRRGSTRRGISCGAPTHSFGCQSEAAASRASIPYPVVGRLQGRSRFGRAAKAD